MVAFPSRQFNNAMPSENAMMPVMTILLGRAEKHQQQLATVGQTPEILAQGQALLNQLRSTDSAQEITQVEKKSATQERYQLFQELYDTVNTINRCGRLVFADDPVKFESPWPARKRKA